MAYTRAWDSANEAAPADTALISGGAKEFRDLKLDIRERLAQEHKFALTDGDEQGFHEFLNGNTASRPTSPLSAGRIYLNTELNTLDFYDGSAWQVVGIESGTRMIFQQTSAPTGWTKDTTANLNSTLLRLITGTVGSRTSGDSVVVGLATGRTVSTGGPTVTGSTAVNISSTNLNLSIADTNLNLAVSGHALNQSEMPSHRHRIANTDTESGTTDTVTLGASNSLKSKLSSVPDGHEYALKGSGTEPTIGRTDAVGNGTAHSHNMTGTTGSHGHTLNGTTGSHSHTDSGHTHSIATHNHTIDLDINYHDVILCSKD